MVDAGRVTKLQVFVDDFPGDATHIFVANTAVVGALGSGRVAVFREAQRTPILVEEVFLLEPDPQVWIVFDCGARVGGMRGTVGG